MQINPPLNTLRKGVLLYRGLRYRKGFGVHSPFVFNLITKVIEERSSYYSFDDIELIRKQLLYREEQISYADRRKQGVKRSRTIGQIVRQEGIKPKQGALLFRLTNYFQSKQILQIGSSMGLSTLYLSSYASDLNCVVLENVPEFATISRIVFEKAARNPIDLRIGSYKELLPNALEKMEKLDFVFFNTLYEQQNNHFLFEACLSRVHDQTVFVFDGIKESRKMREFWRSVCEHPKVTVTIDLYSMGIAFFNKKLHKRDYIVYF
ncbi:MAG: SAM-dependent methyltransferase [Parabacteroides sp.]|nr:SAM-dependent methyltransferase [Parabacteroides sp.]